MPELPEVETIRTGLEGLIVGETVSRVQTYLSPKSFPNEEASVNNFLIGAKVMAVRRRAKVLIIDLSTSYSLVCHLKMTGQMIVLGPARGRWGGGHPNDSFVHDLPDNSTRVHFEFTDGTKLFFNDQRKFGWARLVPTAEVSNLPFMQKVGPEPLEPEFSGEVLFDRLHRRKNTSIKGAILDQSVLAGVGNIYADEALWGARIHPATVVKNVPKNQILKLADEIRAVLALSIERGGSTDRNYVGADGKKGSYLEFARVFRREGQACQRCGSTLEKLRVAGRGTHICPSCQTLR